MVCKVLFILMFCLFKCSFVVAVRGPVPIIQTSEIKCTDQLARGASGKVYKGLYKGTEVAIKVISGDVLNKKEVEEFKKESFMTKYG